MKILRGFVIALIGLVTLAACVFLGTVIGFSLGQDIAKLATALAGLLIGLVVGVWAGNREAAFFAEHIWVMEKESVKPPATGMEQ
jgi:tetrahydromethanopterin S-methyltransferase subunit C